MPCCADHPESHTSPAARPRTSLIDLPPRMQRPGCCVLRGLLEFADGRAQEDSDEDDFNYEDVEVDSELEDDKAEDDFEALTKAARLHDKAEAVGDDVKRKVGPVCAAPVISFAQAVSPRQSIRHTHFILTLVRAHPFARATLQRLRCVGRR